jgi:hypothetical protein
MSDSIALLVRHLRGDWGVGYFFLMSKPGEAALVETSFPFESRVVLKRWLV